MHAAANTKGGVGGVSQAVGREFSAADKPGMAGSTTSTVVTIVFSKEIGSIVQDVSEVNRTRQRAAAVSFRFSKGSPFYFTVTVSDLIGSTRTGIGGGSPRSTAVVAGLVFRAL